MILPPAVGYKAVPGATTMLDPGVTPEEEGEVSSQEASVGAFTLIVKLCEESVRARLFGLPLAVIETADVSANAPMGTPVINMANAR